MIKDLTEGKERRVLLGYTLPMFVGVAFQQAYNIADSIIAGKFAGEPALAAVGASYAITMLFMAVAIGSQIGCTVVVSRLFGAKKFREMKTAISTILISGGILSVFLTVIGLLFSRAFMRLLQTPDDIFADSTLYFQIYIGGFVFLFLYNVVTSVFNSLGDSRTPLYFLICSSLGNIFLDWLFVAVFDWGVAGVAWATFLAQSIAAAAAFLVLLQRLKSIPVKGSCSRFSIRTLKDVSSIAIPSILQQSFISIGNLFIQQLVNSYGSSVIAGYSAAVKLNTFIITGFTTLGNGMSGFTAQNLGAGKKQRILNGWISGSLIALSVAAVSFLAYFLLGKQFLGLFMNKDSSALAIQTGVDFLKIVSPFYFVACIKLTCDGILRGSTRMKEFMISTFTDLVLRVVLAFALSRLLQETGIWVSWPIGWTISTVMSFAFCWRVTHAKPLAAENTIPPTR